MDGEQLRSSGQEASGEPTESNSGHPQGDAVQGAPEAVSAAVPQLDAVPDATVKTEGPPLSDEGENAPEAPSAVSPPGGESAAAAEVYAEMALEQQLRQIQALDPGIRSWEEILSSPRADDFTRLVRQGCTPAEAFQVTQFDDIVARRVAAARRAALHAAYGKAHLRASATALGDDLAIPHDVEQQYRAFFPNWSEAQIRADYRRRRP